MVSFCYFFLSSSTSLFVWRVFTYMALFPVVSPSLLICVNICLTLSHTPSVSLLKTKTNSVCHVVPSSLTCLCKQEVRRQKSQSVLIIISWCFTSPSSSSSPPSPSTSLHCGCLCRCYYYYWLSNWSVDWGTDGVLGFWHTGVMMSTTPIYMAE